MASFATFVVFATRTPEIVGHTKSVNYADQIISSVRGYYAVFHGRRPGLGSGELGGKQLKYVLNVLRKLARRVIKVRRPVLQGDLRRIRIVFNLTNSHQDRTMCVHCLAQWKGVVRSGDLVKRQAEGSSIWDPTQDTHRGLISLEVFRDVGGNRGLENLILAQPSKTDPAS